MGASFFVVGISLHDGYTQSSNERWLVVDRSDVELGGSECNKVGYVSMPWLIVVLEIYYGGYAVQVSRLSATSIMAVIDQ